MQFVAEFNSQLSSFGNYLQVSSLQVRPGMRAENLLLDSRIFLDKEQLSLNPYSSGGLFNGLDYIYFFFLD